MSLDTEPIKKRVEAATPGPWKVKKWQGYYNSGPIIVADLKTVDAKNTAIFITQSSECHTQQYANSRFAAHARTDIPALLDELERTRAAAKALFLHLDAAKQIFESEVSGPITGRAKKSWVNTFQYALDRTKWLEELK